MDNQTEINRQIRYHEEPGFWDDDTNKVIVGVVLLFLLYLTVKYKPWRLLLPVAEQASSVAIPSVSAGVTSATSAGLSVAQMVSML